LFQTIYLFIFISIFISTIIDESKNEIDIQV